MGDRGEGSEFYNFGQSGRIDGEGKRELKIRNEASHYDPRLTLKGGETFFEM